MELVCISHRPFSDQWIRAYNDPSCRNFTVTATNREFKVNRVCIITASSYFADMLMDYDLQSAPLPLDVQPDDFELLLNYLYTGQMELQRDRIWSVAKSAATLSLNEPYTSLANEITSTLSLDNCLSTLKRASNLGLGLVVNYCADYISVNLERLIDCPEMKTIPLEVVRFCLKKSLKENIIKTLMTIAMTQISQMDLEKRKKVFLEFLTSVTIFDKTIDKNELKVRFSKYYLTAENCIDVLVLIREVEVEQKLKEFVDICLQFIGNNAITIIQEHGTFIAAEDIMSILLIGSLPDDQRKCLIAAWVQNVHCPSFTAEQLERVWADFFSNTTLKSYFFDIYLSEDNCMEVLEKAEAALLPEIVLDEFYTFISANMFGLIQNVKFCQKATLLHLKKILLKNQATENLDYLVFELVEEKLRSQLPKHFNASFKLFFEDDSIQRRYAKSRMSVKNCFQIVRSGFCNGLYVLFNHAVDFIAEHFWEFLGSDQFLDLAPPVFIKIMHSQKRPLFLKEEEAFFILESWTNQNPEERKQFFFEGLRGVRLTHIKCLNVMKTKIAFSYFVYNDLAAKKLVEMAITFADVNSNYDFLSEEMNLAHPVNSPAVICDSDIHKRYKIEKMEKQMAEEKVRQLTDSSTKLQIQLFSMKEYLEKERIAAENRVLAERKETNNSKNLAKRLEDKNRELISKLEEADKTFDEERKMAEKKYLAEVKAIKDTEERQKRLAEENAKKYRVEIAKLTAELDNSESKRVKNQKNFEEKLTQEREKRFAEEKAKKTAEDIAKNFLEDNSSLKKEKSNIEQKCQVEEAKRYSTQLVSIANFSLFIIGGDTNLEQRRLATANEIFGRKKRLHPKGKLNESINLYQAFMFGINAYGFVGFSSQNAFLLSLELPTNKLQLVTSHPCAYDELSSCKLDKELLLSCGGITADKAILNTAHLFHLGAREWNKQPEMHERRRSHSLVLFNGSPTATGGYLNMISSETSTERLIIGGGNDRWIPGPSLQQGRCVHSSAIFNRKLVVAGGCKHGYLTTNTVETLDDRMNKWEEGPSLNQSRCYFPLVVYDEKLFALGGGGGLVNNKWSLLARTEWWDMRWPKWNEGPSLLEPRKKHGAVAVLRDLLPTS